MKKEVITIDERKCNGCGACASACHMGAIGMVDGKAKLLREDYCDGLGRCLPVCPTGAISFKECEIEMENPQNTQQDVQPKTLVCGCPSTNSKAIERDPNQVNQANNIALSETHLNQWPVQIKLVPTNAAYFKNAHLLIAADCAAYAYGHFHEEYMRNRITIIGCPKLDEGDYSEKLTAILSHNDIKSVAVARMKVPCCSGIENAVKIALKNCDKMIPWQIITISTDGKITEN